MLMNLTGNAAKPLVRAVEEKEPEGVVRNLGADQSTTVNVWCKSKKSAADNLERCDARLASHGQRIFNATQRAQLIAAAGKAYKGSGAVKAPRKARAPKVKTVTVTDFPERREGESLDAYVDRCRAFVAAQK